MLHTWLRRLGAGLRVPLGVQGQPAQAALQQQQGRPGLLQLPSLELHTAQWASKPLLAVNGACACADSRQPAIA